MVLPVTPFNLHAHPMQPYELILTFIINTQASALLCDPEQGMKSWCKLLDAKVAAAVAAGQTAPTRTPRSLEPVFQVTSRANNAVQINLASTSDQTVP